MTYLACRQAWLVPGGNAAAKALDQAFPSGACEIFSLSDPERTPVPDHEIVARILTSPGDYDLSVGEMLTQKLTNAYARGLSIIRSGAPDDEIHRVISRLLSAPEAEGLVGAAVLPAGEIRAPAKEFCVYDTDAPALLHHGDVVGTFDASLSKSAWRKAERVRRATLRDRMKAKIILANKPDELIVKLRAAGI